MGIIISFVIIILWISHLYYCIRYLTPDFRNIFIYLHILIQTFFYTGLFITAHDSMHGTVSANKKINYFTGALASFLFAGLSYKKLLANHKLHHNSPGTDSDPDFYCGSDSFFVWWAVFLKRYVTLFQILYMALVFNLLKIYFAELSVWLYFVLPSVLSTLQLFYFGTYLPHRRPHSHDMLPFNSRTEKKNHLYAFITCYFFGYHSEHHRSPRTPWWKMYSLK